jgi:hypothetical protein
LHTEEIREFTGYTYDGQSKEEEIAGIGICSTHRADEDAYAIVTARPQRKRKLLSPRCIHHILFT